MKPTTNRERKPATETGRSLAELAVAAGFGLREGDEDRVDVVALAAQSLVSVGSIYRALRGIEIGRLLVSALARTLGVTPEAVRCAILVSAERARGVA